jgi:predicted nucleic acid-binding protein
VNYFDTSYLARLYLEDKGWQKVRELAAADHVACCLHGKVETVAAFHRQFREGILRPLELRDVLHQFEQERQAGAFQWLPMSNAVIDRSTRAYRSLSKDVDLRAAGSLHLACAAENRFKQIYSNDGQLLASASHFGLMDGNVY